MKREEKNLLSRQKILDSARKEFAKQGYGLSSINAICGEGNLSKGILYHYFQDKDELYLLCVQECFDGLTEALRECARHLAGSTEEALNQYFAARLAYFEAHPDHQRLFCEAVVAPPAPLKQRIADIKAPFDRLNVAILTELLSRETLRPDDTMEEIIETFRQYQDFVNARFSMTGSAPQDGAERERMLRRAMRVLLYGVVASKGDDLP